MELASLKEVKYNIVAFKIEVTRLTIDNMTSFDIDFHLIYLLNKALLYHIYNAISSYKKTLYIA